MQFMPDTWLRWGTDGNGDGIADPWNPDDAIHSAARYLAAANGRTDIARAIFAYNHAQWYVDDVLQLAAMFGGDVASADAVFTLDRMALALEQAQEQVASLSEQLDAAEAAESESAATVGAAHGRSRGPRAAALRPRARGEGCVPGRGGARRRRPRRRTGSATSWRRRRPRSRPPRAAPRRHRSRPLPPASCGCRRGRTATSSRSAAGPAPSPSAATTTTIPRPTSPRRSARRSMRSPTASCSRSSTTAAAAPASSSGPLDGLEWVYCHLSYRDPGLEEGLVVSAGQWVGLVGSTGHSTGPAPPSRAPAGALSAGDAVVPGVRRDRLHVAGRAGGGGGPIDAGLRARAAGGAGRGRRRIHTLGGLSSCLLLPTDAV